MTTKLSRPGSYHDHVSYVLSDARLVNLFGEIGSHTVAHVANSLDYMILQDRRKPIHMRLNSPGGSVVDGLAVYDVIVLAAKKTPIHIAVNGAARSMAAIILQAATVRKAYRNAELLLHEVSYGLQGRHSEHRDFDKEAARLQKKLDTIVVERSQITLAELKKLTDRRDYTISAQEALQHGLIDQIIE